MPALSERFARAPLRPPGPRRGARRADGARRSRTLARGVLAILDERGLERVSFCGLSLGGAVGMWLAMHAPERIDRLVLACTSARFGAARELARRAPRPCAPSGVEAIADAGARAVVHAADAPRARPGSCAPTAR